MLGESYSSGVSSAHLPSPRFKEANAIQVSSQVDSTFFLVLGLNLIENLHNFFSIREGIIKIIMADTDINSDCKKDKYLNDNLIHLTKEA